MIRKFWLRDKDNRNSKTGEWEPGHPRVLVGFEVVDEEVQYASATCNPQDKFVRKSAHNQVDGAFRSSCRRCCERFNVEEGYESTPENYPALRRRIVTELFTYTRIGTAKYDACRFELDKDVLRAGQQ